MPLSSDRKPKTENRKPAAPAALPLVAIIGRANVGKSTLFNRLTRSFRALVADSPGVTRDRLYGTVTYADRTFLLIDTGGLVGAEEELGGLVRRQAEVAVAEADALLLVMDGREGLQPGDEEVVEYLRRTGKPLYLVVNKIDHPGMEANLPEFFRFGLAPLYAVSAEHGLGLSELLSALTAHLPPPREAPGEALGIAVAVVGRTNVGKSSLINHFLGEERLLVSTEPGTTRDAVDTPLNWQGTDYLLIDTAGLRRPSHVTPGLERQMVLRSLKAVVRAEIALLLLDAREGLTAQDLRIAGFIEEAGKGLVVLVNKWDLLARDPRRREQVLEQVTGGLEFMAWAPVLPISVKTGYGLDRVFPLVNDIHAQSGRRAGTRELNLLLSELTARVPPPRYRGRPLKFYYLTQPEVYPPTFVAFVNQPQGVPDHYRRYLVKQLRERLGLLHAPLRLFLKGRPGRGRA